MRSLRSWGFFFSIIVAGQSMAGSFSERLMNSFPEGIVLDPKLVRTLNWMESQGWVTETHLGDYLDYDEDDLADSENTHETQFFLGLYPPSEAIFNQSNFRFLGEVPEYEKPLKSVRHYAESRLIEFAWPGGDGTNIAIWLDEFGKQHFVQVGADANGVITDDPLKLLQFIAIGYPHPGALRDTTITPQQQIESLNVLDWPEEFGAEAREYVFPTAFQKFLWEEFGLTVPATASDIDITNFTHFGDLESADPFVQWMISAAPPLSDEERELLADLAELTAAYGGGGIDPDNPPKAYLVSRFLAFFSAQK